MFVAVQKLLQVSTIDVLGRERERERVRPAVAGKDPTLFFLFSTSSIQLLSGLFTSVMTSVLTLFLVSGAVKSHSGFLPGHAKLRSSVACADWSRSQRNITLPYCKSVEHKNAFEAV